MYSVQPAIKSDAKWITPAKIGLAVSLGLLIPALGLPQPVTGPLVNALLLVTAVTTGAGCALLVGVVTPLNALSSGVLPLPLMVLIPFIALGNGVFAGVFSALRARNYWLGVLAGAILKFALLYAAATWLVGPLSGALANGKAGALPVAMIHMMQWPQLATALAGGVLAYGAVAAYRRIRA